MGVWSGNELRIWAGVGLFIKDLGLGVFMRVVILEWDGRQRNFMGAMLYFTEDAIISNAGI